MAVNPQITSLPLDQVEIDPDNVRSVYPRETVEQLRQALVTGLENGEQFIHPPTVYPIGDDRFRVKHGNCRVLAAQGVVDRLHVRIVEPPARPVDKVLDQLGENLLQGGLDPIDTAQALRHLRDNEQLSISGIVDVLAARGIKRGKFWVNMHLGLLRLHPFVVDAVRSGQIPARTAWLLRGLSEADQIHWTRDIVAQGLTQRTVEERLGVRSPNEEEGEEIDTAHLEVAYLQIGERIEQAASREEDLPRRPRRELDDDRRSRAVEKRWQLVAAPVPQSAVGDSKLQILEEHDWSKIASAVERDLAREFVFYGGCEPERAMALAQRANEEAAAAPALAAAANHLVQADKQPTTIDPDSALVALLSLRLARLAGAEPASVT